MVVLSGVNLCMIPPKAMTLSTSLGATLGVSPVPAILPDEAAVASPTVGFD